MGRIKDICTDMKNIKHIMTFSDIAQALANGAVIGQKANAPLSGAVLNLSAEAGKRAVRISEDLLKKLSKRPQPKFEQIPPKVIKTVKKP